MNRALRHGRLAIRPMQLPELHTNPQSVRMHDQDTASPAPR